MQNKSARPEEPCARRLNTLFFYGPAPDDESVDLPKIIEDFCAFVGSVCE